MQEREEQDEARWNQVSDSLDMLFAKVGQIDVNQQKLDTRFDMTSKVLEQMLKDQQVSSKQIDATGQAVPKLTMAQMDTGQEPPSPTSSENSLDNPFFQYKAKESVAGQGSKFGMSSRWKGKEDNDHLKVTLPKMSFPQFTGKNPSIWVDKCQDYFKIFNIPKGMWETYASMNMDNNAAKWLHIYKRKRGFG
jgi:hypothetical protein